jgi:ubiquinone/menaquinone biosynthesis C-methylase UbiE
MTTDAFSNHAFEYSKFRPSYPAELFEHILSLVPNRDVAWDCATGSGQVAFELARHFKEVKASDISSTQLMHAKRAPNIEYVQAPAEETPFEECTFDLITIAQALHWFDFGKFFAEAERVANFDGIIAIWGYEQSKVNPEIDAIFLDFYQNVVGDHWPEERTYIENMYETIEMPFEKRRNPDFKISEDWNLAEYMGYIRTWTAVQRFIEEHGEDPTVALQERMTRHWPADETKQVIFPLFLFIGTVKPCS